MTDTPLLVNSLIASDTGASGSFSNCFPRINESGVAFLISSTRSFSFKRTIASAISSIERASALSF